MSRNSYLNNVSKKTNVSKQDILNLANDVQNKNLSDEANLRDLIQKVAVLADRPVSKEKEEQIISMVKKEDFSKHLNKSK